MYLLDFVKNQTGTPKVGLILSCVLASGLGLSGCSGDRSEGKDEDEDSAEQSEDESDDSDDSENSDDGEDSAGDSEESSGDEDGGEGDSDGEDSDGGEGDSDGEDSDGGDSDGGDGKEDPDKDKDPEGEGGKRDCEKIQWGSGGVKKGQVVPRDDQKGYLDKDGDGKVETEETDVGMCQLHLTGKRCGLVMTGFSG